jgi:hypothetical protein
MRTAAIVGTAIFTLGAAVGHALEIIRSQNYAPGNAGVIFYTDFLLPVSGLVLLWLQHRYAKELTGMPGKRAEPHASM